MTVRHSDPFKELKRLLWDWTCDMRHSRGGYLSPVTAEAGYQSGLTPECLVRMIANGQQSTDPIKACWQKPTGLQAPSRQVSKRHQNKQRPLEDQNRQVRDHHRRRIKRCTSCMPSNRLWRVAMRPRNHRYVKLGCPQARSHVVPPLNSHMLKVPRRSKNHRQVWGGHRPESAWFHH